MIKKLLLTTALLAPGLAYSGTISDPLQPVPPVVPSGAGIACAIGPNYTGSIPADAQTAGFTTCALNSDFSTAFFANVNNWLGGANGCGGAANPIWFNSDAGGGGAAPCSDYNIITDGGNGQVLDMTYTNSDESNGRGATQLISYPAQLYSAAMYIEWRGRVTTQTTHSYDGGPQRIAWGPFKYPPPGSNSFIEWDFSEFYFNPIGIAGNAGCGAGCSGVSGQGNPPWAVCNNGCTDFDPTVMHTYGELITTDGNQAMSTCYYVDKTVIGTLQKLQCVNFTGVTPAVTIWQAFEQMILELGPENTTPFTPFNGPQDVLIQYLRVFSCPTWNSSNPATAVCPGPLVTQ